MRNGEVAAAFEDIEKAFEVGFKVGVRVCDRVSYACLCGEVDYFVEVFGFEEGIEGRLALGHFEETSAAGAGAEACVAAVSVAEEPAAEAWKSALKPFSSSLLYFRTTE